MSDIHDFTQAAAKRKYKPRAAKANADGGNDATIPSDPKPKIAQLQTAVIDAFNAAETAVLPIPRVRLEVYQKTKGEKVIVEVLDKGVVEEVNLKYVTNEIAHYLKKEMAGRPGYDWEIRHKRDCAAKWLAEKEPIPKPKPFLFKSEPGFTFNRLPFDLDIDAPTPYWDDFYEHVHNAEIVKAFVWSILEQKSYDQQYLYIKGEGGDGKGALARFIEDIFLDYVNILQRPPHGDNKHYGEYFEGRRAAIFTDLRNPAFLRSDVVLGLTGGDSLQVDGKSKTPKKVRNLSCKLMFLSNKLPIIGKQESEQRRILYAEIKPRAVKVKRHKDYQLWLWQEGGGHLAQCKAAYERLSPDHGEMIQDEEFLNRIRSFAEDEPEGEFQEFLNETFVVYPFDPKIQKKEQFYISADTLRLFLSRKFDKEKSADFKKWLKITHGIQEEQRWESKNIKVYYRLGRKADY